MRSAQANPQRRKDAWIGGRGESLCGTGLRGGASSDAEGQTCVGSRRPVESLTHGAGRIEHLAAKTGTVDGELCAVQVFKLLRHAMQRACTRCAELQHAAVHLDVECKDVAAQISEYVVRDEHVPEGAGVFRSDVPLISACEAVHGKCRVVADNEFGARVGMLVQHGIEPGDLDVAFAAETAT